MFLRDVWTDSFLSYYKVNLHQISYHKRSNLVPAGHHWNVNSNMQSSHERLHHVCEAEKNMNERKTTTLVKINLPGRDHSSRLLPGRNQSFSLLPCRRGILPVTILLVTSWLRSIIPVTYWQRSIFPLLPGRDQSSQLLPRNRVILPANSWYKYQSFQLLAKINPPGYFMAKINPPDYFLADITPSSASSRQFFWLLSGRDQSFRLLPGKRSILMVISWQVDPSSYFQAEINHPGYFLIKIDPPGYFLGKGIGVTSKRTSQAVGYKTLYQLRALTKN